jgi:RNA polymerase sigma factor (sigma-70 family)
VSPDERLVLRAAQGDRRAFEQIYKRYHQDLYRFCLAMVGNPQDAQDALQNTMVKVLRNLPGETREIRLKPWLYRIARNESVETLRKRRDTAELETQQATVAAVTETAETRERLRSLLADLEQLPARQRAALVMRELSGLDFEQIGASFGSSAAVARQTLYEARLSLRQLEAGREMRCVEVMQELSDADGRVTRRREIRAHLRSCAECRAFHDDIAKRHEDLAALAPLPLAASAGVLQGVLGAGAASGAGGGLGGAIGAGAGKAIAGSALAKSAATAAVVAVVGVSAADRTGVIDLPLPGRSGDSPARSAPPGTGVPANGEAGGASAPGASAAAENGDGAQSARGGKSGGGDGAGSTVAGTRGGARRSSSSHTGQSPPGGGYGRSASERKGRPDQLPTASEKGQQTAGAHKPPPAGSAGQGSAAGDKSSGDGAQSANPAPSPKTQTPAAPAAPEVPAQEPPQAEAGVSHPPGTPPGLGR